MEVRDGFTSGVTVVGSDAPSEYHVAPRAEITTKTVGSTMTTAALEFQITGQPPQAEAVTTMPVVKKRGRPRKYGPDGSVTVALSPKPISSFAPLPSVIDFSADKREKVRTSASVINPKFEVENIDEWVACSVGTNFTPHIITVNAGEDITMKVISFSQQGPRTICILSANGVISSVTLRQPDSSGGTLTYEGRFEILSLSGSFMPNEIGGTRSRTGGMSVSLASADGRVVGGGVAGLLVAASQVHVVVGSFLAGNQHEQTRKKQKHEMTVTFTPAAAAVPICATEPKPHLSTSSSFGGDNWSAMPSDTRNKPTDINISLPGG